MNFLVTRTSDDSLGQVKTINTLEELLEFMHKQKEPLIIMNNFFYKEDATKISNTYEITIQHAKQITTPQYEIEIYDDYRE